MSGDDARGASRSSRPERRRVWRWAMLVVGLGLLGVLASRVDWNDFATTLTHMKPRFVAGAVLAGLAATGLRTLRFGLLFPPGDRWLELYGGFGLMRALGTLLPFRSGELVFLEMLKRRRLGPSVAEMVPAWVLLRTTDLLALGLWFVVALAMLGESSQLVANAPAMLGSLLGIGFAALVLLALLGRRAPDPDDSRQGWLRGRLRAAQWGLRRAASSGAMFRSLVIAVGIWGAMCVAATCSQLALGSPLSLLGCFLAAIAMLVLSLLPVHAPMTLGTGEAAWAGVMVLSGVETERAIVIALGIRVISLLILGVDVAIGLLLFGREGLAPLRGAAIAEKR